MMYYNTTINTSFYRLIYQEPMTALQNNPCIRLLYSQLMPALDDLEIGQCMHWRFLQSMTALEDTLVGECLQWEIP